MTANLASAKVEGEMLTTLVNLVSDCFDEGDYDAGMDILDKVRAPHFKPAQTHIRQLLYIALYPPAPTLPSNPLEPTTPSRRFISSIETPGKSPFRSPRKGSNDDDERGKPSLAPNAEATKRAIALLYLFTETNSPGSLLRGLPAHGKTYKDWSWSKQVLTKTGLSPDTIIELDRGADEADRTVATASMCFIQNKDTKHKDIWPIFAPSFIQRAGMTVTEEDVMSTQRSNAKGKATQRNRAEPTTPVRKRTTRRGKATSDSEEREIERVDTVNHLIVADHAWLVLDWLTGVFEKDAELTEKLESVRYSPLLLSQLPLTMPRTDITAPLNIIFAAWSCKYGQKNLPTVSGQQAQFRASVATRLLWQLINLASASPPHRLDPSECLQQLVDHLTHALALTCDKYSDSQGDGDLPRWSMSTDDFQNMLSSFPPSHHPFKLSLLCSFLAHRSIGGENHPCLGSTTTSQFKAPEEEEKVVAAPKLVRPTRRPAPKALPTKSENPPPISDVTPTAVEVSAAPPPPPPPVFLIPAAADVMSLLALTPKMTSQDEESQAKPEDEEDEDKDGDPQASQERLTRLKTVYLIAKLQILMTLASLGVMDSKSPSCDAWKSEIGNGRLQDLVKRAFGNVAKGEESATDGDGDSPMKDSPESSLASLKLVALKTTAMIYVQILEQMAN